MIKPLENNPRSRPVSNGVKKYFTLVITIIVLGGGAFFTQQWFIESFPTENSTQNPDSGSITFTATTASSVLDVMHTLAAEGSFSFSGRDFPGLGFFVEEMNGRKNMDGYYWILYVNGTPSQTGASQTMLSDGDTIEWRFERGY